MATFKDRNGDPWHVELNVTIMKRLKSHDIDLMTLVNAGDVVEKMILDPILLVDTLYLICKDQADARNVSDEDFGRLVGTGEVIDAATEAMFSAIAGFFTRRGAAIQMASRRMIELEEMATERMKEAVSKMQPETLISGDLSSILQELSESTPAPSPSES